MTGKKNTLRLRIVDCGLTDFRRILDLQHQLQQKRHDNAVPNTILIVEHKPVITLGARENANRLLLTPQQLHNKGIDLVGIRRGGGTTAHNPGQIVFYPIFNLHSVADGVTSYIRQLESVGSELLIRLGLDTHPKKGFPGLWVDGRKIASIGVRVSKGITQHGMAININNDLSIFDHIIPCGLDGVVMTSLHNETGVLHDMKKVKRILAEILVKHFSSEEFAEYENI
ncbi:MAG: lipoyl(octanoyl) transferase LipB [Planctomycetota bacterium]